MMSRTMASTIGCSPGSSCVSWWCPAGAPGKSVLFTDCSYGRSHSIDDYPLIIAGSGGGALATGRHIAARGENACKVSLSILRAMGVRAPEFGVGAGRTTDGLSALSP